MSGLSCFCDDFEPNGGDHYWFDPFDHDEHYEEHWEVHGYTLSDKRITK